MRTSSRFVFVLTLLFAVPQVAGAEHHEAAAAAEPKAWDQAAVADLAGQLGKHADVMRNAVRNQRATETIASAQNLASRKLIELLRGLRTECNRLKAQVEEGKGRDDTLQNFRRIDQMRRDAAEQLRRMFLSESILDQVKEGRAMLEQLRLYYTGEVDTRPGLVGPSRSENSDEKAE